MVVLLLFNNIMFGRCCDDGIGTGIFVFVCF